MKHGDLMITLHNNASLFEEKITENDNPESNIEKSNNQKSNEPRKKVMNRDNMTEKVKAPESITPSQI